MTFTIEAFVTLCFNVIKVNVNVQNWRQRWQSGEKPFSYRGSASRHLYSSLSSSFICSNNVHVMNIEYDIGTGQQGTTVH